MRTLRSARGREHQLVRAGTPEAARAESRNRRQRRRGEARDGLARHSPTLVCRSLLDPLRSVPPRRCRRCWRRRRRGGGRRRGRSLSRRIRRAAHTRDRAARCAHFRAHSTCADAGESSLAVERNRKSRGVLRTDELPVHARLARLPREPSCVMLRRGQRRAHRDASDSSDHRAGASRDVLRAAARNVVPEVLPEGGTQTPKQSDEEPSRGRGANDAPRPG